MGALPSRPTKFSTHATDWEGGDSVELDAVPPDTLRTLVRSIIEHHLPAGHMRVLKVAEDSERQILQDLAKLVADTKRK